MKRQCLGSSLPLFEIVLSLGITLTLVGEVSYGQAPPPITTSGLNTQISAPFNLPGGAVQHNITGGTRPGGGANLFHSFGEFGVPTNNIANFLNDAALPTSNILSRVTGGNPSNIFGTIQTEGFGNANLFLMNPAGIVFGPNASLNVGGAAHFTTADYLRLSDGVQFTALPGAQDALLSVAPVAAFGFLESNPASILVDGSTLAVEEGQTISLVGGDITVSSGLTALGGKIALASVASPGEVLADTFASAPNVNGESFTTMGNITLSEGATLNVSGDADGGDAAGTVIIRGGNLMMTNATISANTGESDGAPLAVDIQLTGDLTMTDTQGSPMITARTTGSGNAGAVEIISENLNATSDFLLSQFALIDTHTSGSGSAGNVNLSVRDTIQATGETEGIMYFIDSGTSGDDGGHGGNVAIEAQQLLLTDADINTGDWVERLYGDGSSFPTGSGGNLAITADTVALNNTFMVTDGFNFGKAGDITITANDIRLTEASEIRLAEFGGGGTITINTNNLLLDFSRIDGETVDGIGAGLPWTAVTINANLVTFRNEALVRYQTYGDGAAGDIRVMATDRMILTDVLDLSTPSGLYTNSFGNAGLGDQGPAGNIFVDTGSLELSGGARIDSTTQSSGKGGDVTILASGGVSFSGQRVFPVAETDIFGLGSSLPSGIFSRTVGSEPDTCTGLCGDAGKISITTGFLKLTDGAAINTGTTSTGQGGSVNVNATGNISITGTLDDGTPGGVLSQTTGAETGSGAGGAIALTAVQNFTLSDGATVSASSSGPGNAGAIIIDSTAGSVTIAQGAGVNSGTTSTGAGGTIFLKADQNFTLSDGATVSASSSGPGNAGNITLGANNTILIDKATITTEAREALGGNIKLTAGNEIQLTDSQVTSLVQVGSGNAGSINLDPDFIVLKNSDVLSTAISGDGGPITLIANSAILIDPSSDLDASSVFGGSGRITIQSPIQNLSGTITPLPQNTLPVTPLYGSRCVAGAGGNFSTFVDSKADSLSPRPGTFLASPFLPLSHGPQAGAVGKAGRFSEGSGSGHAAPLQLASYVPTMLYAQADETTSACP